MVYVKNTITFLSYFLLISSVANSEANIIGDFGCNITNCGEGTCITTDTVPFFECKCNKGWTQVTVFNLSLATTPCIVPNCSSVNLSCGLPAIPQFVLPSNISDPCSSVWCGNGTCAQDGTKHRCACAAGAYNLFNQTDAPCFQECFVGSECDDVPLGPTPPTPTGGASGPSKVGQSSGSSRKWITVVGYMGSFISLFFAIC